MLEEAFLKQLNKNSTENGASTKNYKNSFIRNQEGLRFTE